MPLEVGRLALKDSRGPEPGRTPVTRPLSRMGGSLAPGEGEHADKSPRRFFKEAVSD
jgi:hypothetical protein